MKFNDSIIIQQDIEIVTQLFADPSYLGEWQDGFIKKELVNGIAGMDNAISKMYYRYGNRDMVLTETITQNLLPDSFMAFYHHKHMDNTIRYEFTDLGNRQTQMDFHIEYTRMNWVIPRLMAILFPGMYRKQGEKWMYQFKLLAEQHS